VEGGEAVLAVDDEVAAVGLGQVADVGERLDRIELEALLGEQQDRARDRRLAGGGFVEVLDRGDLGARLALERGVGGLDLGGLSASSAAASRADR
jgi:hypothetical protein